MPGDAEMAGNTSKWETSVSYRWFKSHRHFVGVAQQFHVPVAVQRNRQQSVPDKKTTGVRGVYSQGDAAFADYSIIWNATYRF
jgi:hypothetical protein